MKNNRYVIVIGGGEAWNTHEEYVEYLRDYDFTQEKFDNMMSKGWKDSLQNKLGNEFVVIKPHMPSPINAKYKEWAIWFEKMIPYIQDDVILIGHSLGAIFLFKYLAEKKSLLAGVQLHLVAGVFGYDGGFSVPSSVENIEKCCDSIYIYHSVDDPIVDFSDAQKFKKVLPMAELIKFEDRHHFIQEEFPEIVENIKSSML